MTAKGTTPSKHATFKLSKGVFKYAFKIANADLTIVLAADGLTNITTPKGGIKISMPVSVVFGGTLYHVDRQMSYNAKAASRARRSN